ncbi:hypothetical protein SAMN04487981_101628 [Streptomyces sp. cf386]|uniref:hypothetical protein n=1 Tax=Streptomyces sp. cf386 TaxID=1761904 RepID=UPI000883F9D9|nr:hypothetical protein [Streptomyces sp. cf386]SDM47104.1 hypothetical protein SAMN04487981_101628 [Streptomyces sp. cf386]
MNRILTPLTAAYCLASLAMLDCAITSQQNGSTLYCAIFAACAVLFGLAVGHHAYHRDELRFTRAQLERNARPPTPATDAVVAVALAAACCERWWTSAGAEHEPATCTRKDQTT